jgi:hypothetical protein
VLNRSNAIRPILAIYTSTENKVPARAETVGSIISGMENQNEIPFCMKRAAPPTTYNWTSTNDGTLDSPLGELKKKGN